MTSATVAPAHEYHGVPAWRRNLRLHGWTVAVWLVLLAMVPYWRSLSLQSFEFDIQALAIDARGFAGLTIVNDEADEKVGFEVPYAARMNERGADMPPDEIYPSEAEVAAYRARHITF